MPTKPRPPDVLVDASVAVAMVVADHERHHETLEAIGDRRVGLAGHAAFETYSVITRLPGPARRSPRTAMQLLLANFDESRYLSAGTTAGLLGRLGDLDIAGGSVYDALVGSVALEHGLLLATRDRRALAVYRSLAVTVEVLS